MKALDFTNYYRPGLVVLAVLLSIGVSGSASAQDYGRGAHWEDSRTCESFGAPYGSKEFSKCMLSQQQRRDNAPLHAAEQQRLNSEAARNNLETVRRMQCEREARRDREHGLRPRRCR